MFWSPCLGHQMLHGHSTDLAETEQLLCECSLLFVGIGLVVIHTRNFHIRCFTVTYNQCSGHVVNGTVGYRTEHTLKTKTDGTQRSG